MPQKTETQDLKKTKKTVYHFSVHCQASSQECYAVMWQRLSLLLTLESEWDWASPWFSIDQYMTSPELKHLIHIGHSEISFTLNLRSISTVEIIQTNGQIMMVKMMFPMKNIMLQQAHTDHQLSFYKIFICLPFPPKTSMTRIRLCKLSIPKKLQLHKFLNASQCICGPEQWNKNRIFSCHTLPIT